MDQQLMDKQLINASKAGNLDSVRELLGKGANPNAIGEINSGSVFNIVNIFDMDTTPLVEASKNGHTQIVEELLNRGAIPNKVANHTNNSSIVFACMSGYEGIVRLLLERGADPETVNTHNTPIICIAASNGRLEIVKMLADEFGVDIESNDTLHKTPLMCAIENHHAAVVEYLLKRGVLLTSRTRYNDIPLTLAAKHNKLEIFAMVYVYGEAQGVNPKYRNDMGFDALTIATFNGYTDIIEYLFYNGIYDDTDLPREKQIIAKHTVGEIDFANELYKMLEDISAKAHAVVTAKLLQSKMAHLSHETATEFYQTMMHELPKKGGKRRTYKQQRRKSNIRKSRK